MAVGVRLTGVQWDGGTLFIRFLSHLVFHTLQAIIYRAWLYTGLEALQGLKPCKC